VTDDYETLREHWRNLIYQTTKTLGLIRLCQRLNIPLKPWVRERQIRDEWDAPER
jgi:hypothetical protein